jgi:hypothetical protein
METPLFPIPRDARQAQRARRLCVLSSWAVSATDVPEGTKDE